MGVDLNIVGKIFFLRELFELCSRSFLSAQLLQQRLIVAHWVPNPNALLSIREVFYNQIGNAHGQADRERVFYFIFNSSEIGRVSSGESFVTFLS